MQNTCSNTLELLYRPSFEKSLLMQCCFTFILFSEKIEVLFSTFAQFSWQLCINGVVCFKKPGKHHLWDICRNCPHHYIQIKFKILRFHNFRVPHGTNFEIYITRKLIRQKFWSGYCFSSVHGKSTSYLALASGVWKESKDGKHCG